MSCQIPNCTLNLTNVGKYLDIDDVIIGIKYNFADLNVMKGKYCTTIYKKAKTKDLSKINKTLFYNQITLIVNNNTNHVNVKLFGNGSLHLTGCKSLDEGVHVTKLLYEKLDGLRNKTDTLLLTKDINGVLLDKDNLVYSYKSKRIIGYNATHPSSYVGKHVWPSTYVINKKEYEIDPKTEMLIVKKIETKRRRHIVNFDGDDVGFSSIELLKNKNKFYKKNSNIYYDYVNGLIYHNNDLIIGKISYTTDPNKITQVDKFSDILEIEYKCNPFELHDYALDVDAADFHSMIDLNINCINVYFDMNYKINRQKFYEKLIAYNFICKYKPESYSGIKWMYKLPVDYVEGNDNHGLCICTTRCTCLNITFLIFQSGNVIATGFKGKDQIDLVVNKFITICNGLEEDIRKKVSDES